MTVYPGLIDALSTVGMPGARLPRGTRRDGRTRHDHRDAGCDRAADDAAAAVDGPGGPAADDELGDRGR